MNEKKLKHLEFIQNIITRMNTNSFLIKGWTITLVSALFVLASNGENNDYTLVTFMVVVTFWIVDGFFISTERKFRCLYKEVSEKDEEEIDFSMDTSKFTEWRNSWFGGIFSKTLNLFYGITILACVVVIKLNSGFCNG